MLALIFVVGCAESDPTDSSPDAGQQQSTDTGMTVDAATPMEDATVNPIDAGVTSDSGMEPDAMLAPVDPIAIEDAASALTTAVCEFSDRCQLLELLELVVNDDCATFIEAQFTEGTLAGVQASMDAGRVIYNGEAMARCVAELGSTNCGADLESLFRACDAAFEGQQSAGDACEQSSECAGAQACVLNGGCPGRCGPLPDVGEACNDQTGCADAAVWRRLWS